jgi:hypothetical protein
MALARTAEWIVSYFTTQAVPPSDIYILLNSLASLQAITNTCHLESQQAVLLFHKSLSFLFSSQDFQDTMVHLIWAPVHRGRKQDTRARSRALEACSVTPISGLNPVQSAMYLKRMARLKAFREWAGEWEAEHILSDRNRKLDHFAYGWSILKPPDGSNNPVWRGLVTIPAKSKGKIPIHHATPLRPSSALRSVTVSSPTTLHISGKTFHRKPTTAPVGTGPAT